MKIVHVVEPFATGVNTFIHELVFGMPDHEHIIIHGERDDNRELEQIKLEYNKKATFIKWQNAQREINLRLDYKAYFELKKILKQIDFDILHLHSSKAGIIGRYIGLTCGFKKIIYTPNAASFLRTDISPKKKRVYQLIEKLANRFHSKIISSSRSEFNAYKGIGVKSKIIQNGVTISREEKKTPLIKNTFKIVICGKITIQKNPAFFNRIAKFFENDDDVSFTWIGDGELRHLLTSKNITITGWCSKKEVFEHLEESDIYLSSSSWEGLPLASIEALAFGLPLVMNRCFGNTDLVTPNVNGFLFDSKEQAIEYIEHLKDNKEKYDLLSNTSLKMYRRHYDNYRCALEYEQLYIAISRIPVKKKKLKIVNG